MAEKEYSPPKKTSQVKEEFEEEDKGESKPLHEQLYFQPSDFKKELKITDRLGNLERLN